MAVTARKSTTRKTGTRGRSAKNPPRAAKKPAHRSVSTSAIKETQKPAPRKPGRPAGSARRQSDPILAAQLETISNEPQSIACLRREIEELRASIDVLSEAVDALIKANRERAMSAETEPQPGPQDPAPEPRQTEDIGPLITHSDYVSSAFQEGID